ncbi:MAG: tRNA (adenosine(37)-N6)-threonylcarbamoyltransferase complex dimerization subunit type 1 TsaB [Bacteroidales bacterium]|nr:MAG: tRNA (adenosine(37)-N6)-threonylcarbamoyltransferase complex dimerization subunit type 1 TsaB [Bacteroidales bacterium]
MSKFLLIESGTNVCSVAISVDGKVVGLKESSDEKAHASQLTLFIDRLTQETGISISNLDAVVVSKGPGSYTGLRIGVSAAKGICYAAEKPLISINSLDSMVYGATTLYQSIIERDSIDYYCPMIDARRMEVYTALYDKSFGKIKDIEAQVVDEKTFKDILDNKKILFFGNGAIKCRNTINHHHAYFADNFLPSSKFMIPLALDAFSNQTFEDVAYFEPYYLKDFVATVSQKDLIPGLQKT